MQMMFLIHLDHPVECCINGEKSPKVMMKTLKPWPGLITPGAGGGIRQTLTPGWVHEEFQVDAWTQRCHDPKKLKDPRCSSEFLSTTRCPFSWDHIKSHRKIVTISCPDISKVCRTVHERTAHCNQNQVRKMGYAYYLSTPIPVSWSLTTNPISLHRRLHGARQKSTHSGLHRRRQSHHHRPGLSLSFTNWVTL